MLQPEDRSPLPDDTTEQSSGTRSESKNSILSPGELLSGRFRLVRFLGQGGMGEVYEAEDLELRERVALKTVRLQIAREEDVIKRFQREIHLARRVTHPNVCRIYDVFHHRTANGQEITFLSMELLEGETLAAALARGGRMTPEQALPLVSQMAAGLGAAHRAGVIHRDFKTGNVMLVRTDDGGTRAVVTDFGLARGTPAPASLTASVQESRGFAGTPLYMAPEQVEGATVTSATDVYALGLVLYEMLTGKRPFEAETPLAAAVKRLKEGPAPPRAHVPELDPKWEAVILRCLQRDPRERFSTTDDVPKALAGERVAPGRRQRRVVRATVLAGLVLVAVIAYRMGQHTSDPTPQGNTATSQPRRTVAVLGFHNASGRSDVAWLSTAISEMLTTELAAGEKLRTVPGENVAGMKSDLGLPPAETFGKDTLARIRQNLGTDYVVLGSYTVVGRTPEAQVRLDLRLQDAATGETLAAMAEIGAPSELFDLVSRAGAHVRGKLGVAALSPSQTARVRASFPKNPEAARLYAEGLSKLRLFEAGAARDLLLRAAAIEADHPLIHSGLAAAWSALGYDERAAEEARQSFELASQLALEDRLALEARHREITKDWPRAIEIYTSLSKSFPDVLDYCISLAGAQISGGKSPDALRTIEGLRQLSPLAKEDPRLDLSEATATMILGDFRRCQAAAARGVQRSRALRAELLAANAQIVQARALLGLGDPEKARATLEQARDAFVRHHDRTGAARATTNLGNLLYVSGDSARALRLYQEALTAYLEAGNKSGAATALNNIGNVLDSQGDRRGARRMYEASLATSREINNQSGIAMALGNLGGVLVEEGHLEEAARLYQQSRTIYQAIGNKSDEATALQNLGSIAVEQGNPKRAQQWFQETLAIYRTLADQSSTALVLYSIADLMHKQGELVGATARAEEALALQRQLGELSTAAQTELLLAALYQDIQRPSEAEKAAGRAAELFHEQQRPEEEAAAYNFLAQLSLGQDRRADAERHAARASALLEKSTNTSERLSAAITAARLLHAGGKTTEAVQSLSRLIASSKTSRLIIREYEARLALGEIELASGRTAMGRTQLLALAKDTRTKGYEYYARKAESALAQADRPSTF